jgi:hypothetical protein
MFCLHHIVFGLSGSFFFPKDFPPGGLKQLLCYGEYLGNFDILFENSFKSKLNVMGEFGHVLAIACVEAAPVVTTLIFAH